MEGFPRLMKKRGYCQPTTSERVGYSSTRYGGRLTISSHDDKISLLTTASKEPGVQERRTVSDAMLIGV